MQVQVFQGLIIKPTWILCKFLNNLFPLCVLAMAFLCPAKLKKSKKKKGNLNFFLYYQSRLNFLNLILFAIYYSV